MNLDVLIPSLAPPTTLPANLLPPKLPALEHLLSRADHRIDRTPDGYHWVLEQFGVSAPYPLAAVTAQYDGLDCAGQGWIFASLVHLEPDRDRLRMFPFDQAELEPDEFKQIEAVLSPLFEELGLTFIAYFGMAYLRCPVAELPETTPLHLACRRSLFDVQPQSKGAINWMRLQNELQMVLHAHPVNAAREATGKPTINGVWFWGGGVMPKLVSPAYNLIDGSDGLLGKLAVNCGIKRFDSSPEMAFATGSATNMLLKLSSAAFSDEVPHAGVAEWGDHLTRCNDAWFIPIYRALRSGSIQRLRLFWPRANRTETFELHRHHLLTRALRRTRPVTTYA